MGKKRAAAAPIFPFPGMDHFSDYGFDPQLVHFFSQPEAKRPSTRHQQPPPPLESARLKLQNPISTKHLHRSNKQQQQQRRRRWWSSAASAALLLFKRPSSSRPNLACAALAVPSPALTYGTSYAVPLYLADDDGCGENDAMAACACWAPAMRSGHHLGATELCAPSASVPYVSLRDANLGRSAAVGGPAPTAMPIYLVT